MRVAESIIEYPKGDLAARTLGAGRSHHGALQPVLALLGMSYGAGMHLRNAAYDAGMLKAQRVGVPTISVGNIVAGGSGKTPFTRWLVMQLEERGHKVAVLHGGYGADEPALHRRWLPQALVIEERDRVRAAKQAITQGATAIVLDDAFQHRRLARSLDIVLVPAETESRRMLPSGPLREPESSLARAGAIVVTRKSASAATAEQRARELRARFEKPTAVIQLAPMIDEVPQKPVLAVCSVARPDSFLANLRDLGIEVTALLAYPDHYEYSDADIAFIAERATSAGVVITAKDAVKLLGRLAIAIHIVHQTVSIESGAAELQAAIDRVL